MPSSTFYNLTEAKQHNMKDALLHEFSHHSLADAQVARIIQDAAVARGTFYKYFSDIMDAYQWLLKDVMSELQLHPPKLMQGCGTSQEYQKMVHQLIERIQQSDYVSFLQMYYEENEGIIAAHNLNDRLTTALTSQQWGIMVLCHEAIKESVINPHDQIKIENRLGEVLSKIIGG